VSDGLLDEPRRLAVLAVLVCITVASVGLAAAAPTTQAPAEPASVQTHSTAAVTASCTVGETYPEPGEDVYITSSGSSGDADRFRFDRTGDGTWDTTFSEDGFVFFNYSAGTYTPRIQAVNSSTEESDIADCPTIEVAENTPPAADVVANQTTVRPGETVAFDANGSTDDDGTVQRVAWDFDGDGTREIYEGGPQQTYTYSSPGTYNVTATAYDDDNAPDTAFVVVTVQYADPTARCSVAPQTVSSGELVTVDARDSTDADLYRYDFDGDGTWDTDYRAAPTANTSYETADTYTPRVEATNTSSELRDTTTCPTVTVAANQPPTADLAVSPGAPEPGDNVTFDASGSTDSDGSVATYRWDFDGDGLVDRKTATATVTHAYADEGTYGASVTVVDDDGSTDDTSRAVEVYREAVVPTPRCSLSETTIHPGETVTIDASESSDAVFVEFDVDGDGEYEHSDETDFRVNVTYGEPGTYAVSVRASSNTGDSRTADCGAVTVTENAAPNASLSHAPTGPEPGDTVTLDASASTDPDGTVSTYRWDFDGDGTTDRTTNDPQTTYSYGSEGTYATTVTVVDDEGATDTAPTAVAVERQRESIRASCTLSETAVEPGQTVTVDAGASENAVYARFDPDGDGEYERSDETDLVVNTTYDEPGTYAVGAALAGDGQQVTVDCGVVTVAENEAPVANGTFNPEEPRSGKTVTFDASNSTDVDGRIVEYRWDFDDDGTVDHTSTRPVVTHAFPDTGAQTVGLTVVDEDGAVGATTLTVGPVRTAGYCPLGEGMLCPLPGGRLFPAIAFLLGVGGAGSACALRRRRRPNPPIPKRGLGGGGGGDQPSGVTAYASGTLDSPRTSGSVAVTDLGFEPDLLLFRATNTVTAGDDQGGPGDHRTDGWTYGAAKRTDDGTLEQHVLSAANDFQRTDAAVGAARTGRVLDLVVHEEDAANAVAGTVQTTTPHGFELAFDTSALPGGEADDEYVVMYQAFQFESLDDVSIGHFVTPETAGTHTVDLGVDANHVVLTATNAVAGVDQARVTDGAIGISHGDVVGRSRLSQTVQNSTIDPAQTHRNAYAAHDDRALSVLHLDDGEVRGRTSAEATALGDRLELTYDAVHAPGGTPARSVVTYVAMDTGDEEPAIGYTHVPGPESGGETHVDVGFAPSFVEFTGCHVDAVNAVRTAHNNLLGFGWTYGTALVGSDGLPIQQLLQSAVDADALARRETLAEGGLLGSTAPGISGASSPLDHVDATTSSDDDPVPDGGGDPTRAFRSVYGRQNVATLLAMDDAGRITGWDDVRVTGVTPRGFRLAIDSLNSTFRERASERRPVVFYKAWPAFADAEDRRAAPTETHGAAGDDKAGRGGPQR
jgi:PKD repeat protein